MRKSRSKVKREYRGKKYLIVVLFIVILPIISIIPGYLGSKYLIIPRLFSDKIGTQENSNESEKNVTPTSLGVEIDDHKLETTQQIVENSLDFNGFDFFSVQVGSFTTKANADALVKELEQQNMGSYIYEKDGFKVLTISLIERNQIDMLMPLISSSYEGGFVVPRSIPNKTITYSAEEYPYVNLLQNENNKLTELLKTLSDAVFKLENKDISKEEFKILLSKSKVDMLKIKEELMTVNPPTRFQQLHDDFLSLTNVIPDHIDNSINDSDEILIVTGKNLLTALLFEYSSIISFF